MPRSISEFQRQFYDQSHTEMVLHLSGIADLFLSSHLNRSGFQEAMLESLKQYYIRLALVAKGGRSLTDTDISDLGLFLALQQDFLSNFSNDIQEFVDGDQTGTAAFATAAGVFHRSSLYANAWSVYSRYLIPASLADVLPALPGIDCLGGPACGCFLIWDVAGDSVEVLWKTTPGKETCVLCEDFAISWNPLVIPLDELDPDIFSEDQDFYSD